MGVDRLPVGHRIDLDGLRLVPALARDLVAGTTTVGTLAGTRAHTHLQEAVRVAV